MQQLFGIVYGLATGGEKLELWTVWVEGRNCLWGNGFPNRV